MACPQILTGSEFVTRIVTHIDCQARFLGSYGYTALSEPGSPASTLITGLLTLFVAIWGFRLAFGYIPQGRDLMGDVLKVGIVLTLAFSWPAFRTVVHDLALDGPAHIASLLATPGAASTGGNFVERLQGIDNGIQSLIDLGTGRFSDQFLEGQAGVASFAGTALQDDAALGWARLTYLAGLIGSLGLLRLVAGLLLALAPLAAGLLLFDATRGIFAGWLRGLVLTLLASVGVTVILAIELAVLEPFLRDALQVRSSGYAAPSAPIELFAITAGFALLQLLSIWLLAKVAFMRGWTDRLQLPAVASNPPWSFAQASPAPPPAMIQQNRAERISEQVENRLAYEERRLVALPSPAMASSEDMAGASGGREAAPASSEASRQQARERLGSSYRRNRHSRMRSNRGDSA